MNTIYKLVLWKNSESFKLAGFMYFLTYYNFALTIEEYVEEKHDIIHKKVLNFMHINAPIPIFCDFEEDWVNYIRTCKFKFDETLISLKFHIANKKVEFATNDGEYHFLDVYSTTFTDDFAWHLSLVGLDKI